MPDIFQTEMEKDEVRLKSALVVFHQLGFIKLFITVLLVASLLSDMTQQLQEGNAVSVQGFGTFEVKKKAERITINPTTKLRMLVPPKLVLNYKPSSALKDKFK